MINPTKDLSFNKFYLTEFFNQALERGKNIIPEKQYAILRELVDYIVIDENFIRPLEMLAKYHGTNELTIFLFDMMGRVEDYEPDMIYAALPDLADDFVSVYNLVCEEDFAVNDLQKALEDFREKYAAAETVSTPPQPEKEEEKTFTFNEFYNKEYLLHLNARLDALDEEKKAQYLAIINAFFQIWNEEKNYKDFEFGLPVYRIFEVLENLFPAKENQLPPFRQMQELSGHINELVNRIRLFEESDQALFNEILRTGTLPHKIPEPAPEKTYLPPEEVPEEALTIDALLRDYFKSEVQDHRDSFIKEFDEIKVGKEQDAPLQRIISQVKSLKEISMIHGYNGIEYACGALIAKLEDARRKNKQLTPQSLEILNTLLDEFLQVDRFIATEKNDPVLQNVYELLDRLEATFAAKEISATKEAEPEEISFDDTAKVLDILSDLLQQIHHKIQPLHNGLKETDTADALFGILEKLRRSTSGVFPPLKQHFLDPLDDAYRTLIHVTDDRFEQGQQMIEGIWQMLFSLLKEPLNLAPLAEEFEKFHQFVNAAKEPLFNSGNDQVVSAFAEAHLAFWKREKIKYKTLLVETDPKNRKTVHNYFLRVKAEMSWLKLDGYVPLCSYLEMVTRQDSGLAFNEDMAFELLQSFELALERIKTQGKSGSAEDILSVISELVEVEQQPGQAMEEIPGAAEEAVEAPAEEKEQREEITEAAVDEEEEEDVEEMFLQEVRLHLDMARDALRELDNQPKNRTFLNQVENALHSVKASAQVLNKDTIAHLAGQVEELAEIYGKSTLPIPDNLYAALNDGVVALLELATGKTDKPAEIEQTLQDMLDTVPITDGEPLQKESVEEKDAVSETEEKTVAEKPLFAEHEDVDEDLLDIFGQEAKSFLSIIDTSFRKLKKDNTDLEALNQFEYAAHSLKSAAKMLGFREIAQVTDSMEQMIEAIKNGEIQNSDQIENALGQGIEAVKKLSSGEKVSSSHLSHIINILELAEPEILQEEEIPTEEPEETTETAKPEVAAYFIEEANELLTGLNMDLLELEKMPQSETLLSNILRNLHTLKGSSLMLKYERIGELCHRLEDYFEFYKTHRTKGDPEMLAPAFVVLDLVEELLNNLKEGNGETADQYTARLAEIDNKLFLYQNFDQQEEIKTPPKKKRGRPKKTATAAKSEDDNVIKISTGYLDNLVNMASELVVSRTEMASYFENLKEILAEVEQEKKLLNQAEDIVEDILEEQEYEKDTPEQETKEVQPEEEKRLRDVSSSFKQIMGRISVLSSELQRLSQDFEKNLSRISSISNALHSDILKVRMVPIENLFNRFPRPVRDMAREQNKKINLVIEGNETEMDRAMVEALADPLMHIVRNAVDHGIETSEERKKQGKSAAGTITLRARQDKNQVVIEVEDDGAGIDLEKIKKSIQKRKLATPAAIKKMNEAELLDFLFYPEFTTREEADKTSGRGIGLDVVANQIQKLKGNIRIRTEKNEGTTFSIRVPLTLVISQALMTKIRDQIVAIPIIAVQESVHIETQSILVEDERQYLQVRGKLLPFVPITQVLKFGDTADEPELNTALILYDAGVSIALGIPEILGRQEIVIKTLGGHLQNVEYIAGGTILGNGEVALILDYAAVIRTTEQQFFGKVSETGTKRKKGKAGTKKTAAKKRSVKQDFLSKRKVTRKKITNRKPRILIVDDSSSVRNFVGGVLEKKNFATLKVNDGQSAIDLLDSENVDLIITDLEMPNMHGFELISLIRQKEQFKDLPIVILTGKTGRGEQKKGAELGADAFIGKPFKESDLLDVITRFIDTGSKK